MKARTKRLAPIAASVLLGAIVFAVCVWAVVEVPGIQLSLFEAKKSKASTLLMYEVVPGEGFQFAVLPQDKLFYVVSHSYMPGSFRYDSKKVIIYAFDAQYLNPAGQIVHRQHYYEVTHQSKAGHTKDGWADENAFLPPGQGELADDRITALATGTLLPQGGSVRLVLSEASYPLLLRIHRISERTEMQRLRRFHELPEYRKEAIATYMGLSSLDDLALADAWSLFQNRWERVEATDQLGNALPMERMYYTGFRLPPEQGNEALITLGPMQAAALNFLGPLDLTMIPVEMERPAAMMSYSIEGNPLTMKPAARVSLRLDVTRPPTRLHVPQGLQTLVLENEDAILPLRFKLALSQLPKAVVGRAMLIPDTSREWAAYAVPGIASFETTSVDNSMNGTAELTTLAMDEHTLLRVDVRARLKGPVDTAPRTVVLSFLDRKGGVLSVQRATIPAVASPFERDIALDSEFGRWLSEPVRLFLVPPRGCRHVRFSSPDQLSLRPFVERPEIQPEDNPYPEAELLERVWRYRKLPEPIWEELRFDDWQERQSRHPAVNIAAMTRLTLVPASISVENPAWRKVRSASPGNDEVLLGELPVAEGATQEVSDTAVIRIACPAGQSFKVALPIDPTGPDRGILDALYYIPTAARLQGTLHFYESNLEVASAEPMTRRDTVRVRKLSREARVKWTHSFAREAPLVFVETRPDGPLPPPPPGCRLFKAYSVTRIAPGATGKLMPYKFPGISGSVNLVVYSEALPSAQARIDGGRPQRRPAGVSGEFTVGTRELVFTPATQNNSVFMPSLPETVLLPMASVAIGLQADLTPGSHSLELRNTGAKIIWVRAFQNSAVREQQDRVQVKSVR